MFITLLIDRARCECGTGCSQCAEICPVDVFRLREGELVIDVENEDECLVD